MQRALILLIGVLATTGAFLFAPPCAYAQDFSGEDRYDTARLEAQEAYPNGSSSVVLACGEGWADALSATSLAGALRAPLLFTPTASLSTHTVAGIESLGCSNVIIIGNQNSVSNAVEQQIKKFPEVKSTIRLGGESRIDTQMAIYQYGLDKKLWTSERIIVANAWNFADALTASPLAYRYASPLFLVSDYFTPEQEEALIALMPTQIAVMGGSTAVCDYTYGFLQAL
ncbi:MAG: cell wall-binding repeat-containing protein, partial [Gordonibacter sp.]|uniref:cell wall-binding repeat-containing protein n=1 Tax=Gordonibacter sp. TaxID=1968902 RepID=UPI002FC5FDD6